MRTTMTELNKQSVTLEELMVLTLAMADAAQQSSVSNPESPLKPAISGVLHAPVLTCG